ncbi:MAG: matrixin family metalloprotease [Phycisphaerales bacterium]|nr:MAG: matrixin family metalloprotease [Phycisphaerales bacterium]
MKRRFPYFVCLAMVGSITLLRGDGTEGFYYYDIGEGPVVWATPGSERYLSPTTFPWDSDAETLALESMGLWNIVPGSDFAYTVYRLDQDYPIDHYDGYNDTAAVAASELDPGTLAVTYLVGEGANWYDMDVLFSDSPGGVGYTLAANPDCDVVTNPTPTNGFSFLLIAVHEMGHALGLAHNPLGDEPPGTPWFVATMNPSYPAGGPVGQENIIEVHTDDRNGIRFLYPAAAQVDPPFHDLAIAGYTSGPTIGVVEPVWFDPPSIAPLEQLSVRSVIENFGTADEESVWQGFYISTDEVIDNSDQLVGLLLWDLASSDAIEFDMTMNLIDDVAAGTYYFGSILDDQNEVAEVYEDNNAIAYCETITITQAAPEINEIDPDVAPCGRAYVGPAPSVTFPINMGPITWSLERPLSGMTIDSNTGEISWASPLPSTSPYAVTIRATNGAGSSTTQLQLTVVTGDTSGNGTLDLADLPDFTTCLTGPKGTLDATCTCADLDGDDDADLSDIAELQVIFEN